MGPLPPTTMEPIPLIPSTATPADLILLLCKISCNSLGISDSSTFQECGVGLYPETISLLNHSCIPNCTIIFDKATTTARIVTLQEISIGQELTISYIDSADLFQTRHLELSTRYHFNCICPLCTTQTLEQNIWKCLSTPNCPGTITVEDPTPTTTTTTHCPHCKSVQPIAERTKSFKSLSRKDAQNDLTQQLQLLTLQLQTYPEYATTNGTYSSSSSSNNNNNNKNSRSRNKNTAAIILKTRQQLYNLYLGYQNWHLAFQICRDLINDLQLLYPKMSPALGLQYLAGARLGLLMTDEKRNVDLKELREWAHEAVVIFDGLLGWNHVLTQEAREKREEIGVLHSM
ncbi:hypothetical protein BDR26DRAFT_855749 [Obelidium mucronatum]|nr:hypothetical protein BDR26DRAFT_855749 [Obelidium mucronatum]